MLKSRFPVLALVVFIGLTSVNWTPEEAGIRLSDPKAVAQHGTSVMPVLTDAIPPGKNVLWCATFQMTWDAAAARFGRPLRLTPASKLADSLNRNPFDRRWVDEASVFTAEGVMNEDVLGRIDHGMRNLSGKKSKLAASLKKNAAPDDLVFFASLKKDLEFPQPFGKLGTWKLGKRKVPWFGFTPEQKDTGPLREQVRVHHYGAKDDFVIELLSKSTGDQLILAKLPATPKTPGDASRSILKRLRAKAPQADGADLLAVPNTVVEESAEFTQLEGRRVAGTSQILRKALQTIDFRMDEKGVKLKSEAALSFGCSAQMPVVPRLMVLDPPFALIMKRKGAPQPYFVAWFANADLLGGD
jgi:hypothetical protein